MAYHLFEVYGIELEYMVVKSDSLKIAPVVDQLLTRKNGSLSSEVENGPVAWSNELVAHVVELKTNGPAEDLEELEALFTANVKEINGLLGEYGCQLLPSAAHPLMDPATEMKLWPHENNRIYELYNRIFDCRGHGWSNLQSMHINLPFSGDEEFGRLHAAVRILLPIIPALSASSPVLDGRYTGFRDTRMHYYKTNQKEIPEMTGKVIPEQVFDRATYFERIFEPINRAIRPHDQEHILDQHFLNSRGAIARFDRGAIEIRVIDLQECPKADISIAGLSVESLRLLVSEELVSFEDQQNWHENDLAGLLDISIRDAEAAEITDQKYLALFDLEGKVKAGEIWKKLLSLVRDEIPEQRVQDITWLLRNKSLASRLVTALDQNQSQQRLIQVYRKLGRCLAQNEFFDPLEEN